MMWREHTVTDIRRDRETPPGDGDPAAAGISIASRRRTSLKQSRHKTGA